LSVEQQFGDISVAVVSRHVQRSQLVLAFWVRVGASVQQQSSDLQLAELGGHVQRSKASLSAVIDSKQRLSSDTHIM